MLSFIRRLLSVTLILAIIWAAGFLYFTALIPSAVEEEEQVADGIVVLTGGRDRLPESISLLKAGGGARLLISGVNEGIDDEKLKDTLGLGDDAGRELFKCCIDTGRVAQDTVGNAVEIAEWAHDHKYRSIQVVTADYHMPRSLAEIGRYAPDIDLMPHPVFPAHMKTRDWWRYPGTAQVLASEYNKFVLTKFKIEVVDAVLGGPVS